jgi:hypothetical protein
MCQVDNIKKFIRCHNIAQLCALEAGLSRAMLHIGSGMSVDINGRGSLSDAHMKTSKSCSMEPEVLFGMLPYRWMKLSRSYAAAVRVSN